MWQGPDLNISKSVDLAPVLTKCFDDVVNIVIFGEKDISKVPTVHGMPLSIAIEHKMMLVFKLFKSKPHQLTFGFSSKYLLTPLAREHHRLHNDIVEACARVISERKKNGKKDTPNLIDMMLEWNQKCDSKGGNPDEKYSLHSMIGLLMFFYAAGTDTSRSTLTSLLHLLGEEKEARKLVEKDLLQNLLNGSWDNVEEVGNVDLDWERCHLLK